jgi:hypothetical protein
MEIPVMTLNTVSFCPLTYFSRWGDYGIVLRKIRNVEVHQCVILLLYCACSFHLPCTQ